ncbi:hypothetical protein [Micromonospora zhanjiangensis]|uniref:DUF3307 domain-containing protein n=1 Tax=Micromonospora zhanjiangensis TaxID=1522057 RepID=A0ABV8KU71_9ACTN
MRRPMPTLAPAGPHPTPRPEPVRDLVAAGWFGHAVWDAAHHRARRVVPRGYAQWCGVVDLLGTAAILLLP